VIAASILRAHRRPRIAVWVLSYFALHGIESGPINLEMAFEHRMYAPMVPALLLLIELVAMLEPISRKRAIAWLAALLVPMAIATFSRNETWGDPMEFQADRAAKSPNSTRALYDYGTTLGKAGRLDEAEQVLSRLLELDPDSSVAHNQLGNVYLLTNRPGPAFEEYQRAVELGSDNPEALYNLGHRFLQKRNFRRAAELFEHFLDVAPAGFEREKREVAALLQMFEGH
jgi:tetratricopeptide (TPR) repeat protein